jgi:tripartite-type tricarboxylate transporter receptor subunit TctC
MPISRRSALAGLGAVALARPAGAQAFPSRPIRFVVPFPPGGSLDAAARIIAERLSPVIGQPVVVENRPGAGGNVGADVVAKAAPDGHTILMGALSIQAVNPHLYRSMPFDSLRDFVAVTQVGDVPNVLIVRTDSPTRTVRELIAAAKANPQGTNFGSGGNGSGGHLAGALLNDVAKIEAQHIPFAGGAPALTALLGGQTQYMFDNLANAWGALQGGRVRPIAVTTTRRSPLLPDVPTMAEAGVPGFDISTWFGVFAPAGTPADVIARLHQTIAGVLRDPATVERFRTLATDPVGNTPAEFEAFVRAEHAKYREIVRISGARVE